MLPQRWVLDANFEFLHKNTNTSAIYPHDCVIQARKECEVGENKVAEFRTRKKVRLNWKGRRVIGFENAKCNCARPLTLIRAGSPASTRVRYSCFISFSSRLGRPGYMLEPPESTICLYNSDRTSTGAVWIVENSISDDMKDREKTRRRGSDKQVKELQRNIPATPGCSTSTRCGWNMHSGASNRSCPTLITRPSGS